MHYELNFTTSRLRRTPPKILAEFQEESCALVGTIVPPKKLLSNFQEESYNFASVNPFGALCIMNYEL